jgi:hypothetical protein
MIRTIRVDHTIFFQVDIKTKSCYRSMGTTGDPDRPVTGPDRITTSPTRAGTGEPLHRLEPVPVRGFGSANDKHTEATERRVLDSITQTHEHTFN